MLQSSVPCIYGVVATPKLCTNKIPLWGKPFIFFVGSATHLHHGYLPARRTPSLLIGVTDAAPLRSAPVTSWLAWELPPTGHQRSAHFLSVPCNPGRGLLTIVAVQHATQRDKQASTRPAALPSCPGSSEVSRGQPGSPGQTGAESGHDPSRGGPTRHVTATRPSGVDLTRPCRRSHAGETRYPTRAALTARLEEIRVLSSWEASESTERE